MIDDRNILRPYNGDGDRAKRLFGDDDDGAARAEKLFGETEGFGEWTKVATFDGQQLAFPGAVEVTAAAEFVDLTVDALRVALAWDGAQIAAGGPFDVQAGKIVSIPVSERRGETLEVWTSAVFAFGDSFGSARYLDKSEAIAREKERAAADQENANKGQPDPADFFKGAGVIVAIAAVVVVAVVVLKVKG